MDSYTKYLLEEVETKEDQQYTEHLIMLAESANVGEHSVILVTGIDNTPESMANSEQDALNYCVLQVARQLKISPSTCRKNGKIAYSETISKEYGKQEAIFFRSRDLENGKSAWCKCGYKSDAI